jgi:histidinol-phosphatase (PHP family)
MDGNVYDGNMKPERLGDYIAEIRALGREWAERGGLDVLLGLEIDWLSGSRSPRDPLFDGLGLDFAIGSVHFVDVGGGPFAVDGAQDDFDARVASDAGGDPSRIWKAYYRNISALIESGGFDILGHFDLIRKNNPDGRWFDEDEPAYLGAAFDAARLLAGTGIVAEINYGGMARGKTKTPYPSLPILRELKRLGVPITLSADAHQPEHLAPSYREAARDLARAAGYASIAVLANGTWTEAGIDEA